MKYLKLLSLELLHDYYSDQRCPDFQIEPTPETLKLIGDCRCVLRPTPNGVRILVLADDLGIPFIALPEKPVFAFHLKLQNPDFGLFTDLTGISKMAAPLYINGNSLTSGELTLSSRKAWSTETFVVRQPSKKEPFILGGRPLSNLKTSGAFVVTGLGEKPGRKNYDENARIITVNTSTARSGTPFTITYPTAPQLARDVFADIEISYDETPLTPNANANDFQVVFKAKEARWKYYVITDKTDNKASLPTIEDKDKVVVFNIEDRSDLTRFPDPSDDFARRLAEQYPNRQYFRFVSNALIPCQKAARKTIQFQLDGGEDDRLIAKSGAAKLQH